MSAINAAAQALADALGTVEGLAVTTDPGASVHPPTAIVGPPRLRWEVVCSDPSTATFPIWVVVRSDEKSTARLFDLVPVVAGAIEATDFAAVTEARPVSYATGSTLLPAYELTVETSL